MEILLRALKESLKSAKWEESRYLVRFLADLVNCHVLSAGSLLQLLDNFVDAALEEGVPQVRLSVTNKHVSRLPYIIVPEQQNKIQWGLKY